MKNNNIKILFCILKILPYLIIITALTYILIKAKDLITVCAVIPFLICIIASTSKIIFQLFNIKKLVIHMNRVYVISFLLYTFEFLGFATYICIKGKNYQMLMFTIPFWCVAFYIIYKQFIKK